MPTEAETKASYKQAHDILTEQYYEYGLWAKAEFEQLHGQIWDDMKAELIAKGYLIIPTPPRNIEAEVDDLKAKVAELEKKKK